MKNTSKAIIGTAMIACLGFVQAEETEVVQCDTVDVESVSLYFMTIIKDKSKISPYYKSKIDEINALAAKHEWAEYKMASQDVSVSQSSYGPAIYDVTVSVSFQTVANYDVIGQIAIGTDAYSISASRYSEDRCPDSYSY